MDKSKEKDVKEMIDWLEKDDNRQNDGKSAKTSEQTPLLLKLFTGKIDELDEDAKKRYKKYIDITGKTAFVGLTGFPGLGILGLKSVGIAGMSSAALSGMGLVNLLFFLSPVTLAGTVGGAIAYSFISKKIKSKEGKALSTQLEQLSKKFIERKEAAQKKLQENATELERIFKEYTPVMLQKIKTTSEHISIQIDDLVNMDQNERIMQYQKIALNQYQEQKALRETMEEIVVTYNRIIEENEKLIEKLRQYEEKENICYRTNELLE